MDEAETRCPRCEDLLRDGGCRGCCSICEVLLVDGACPNCPLPGVETSATSVLHDVGELIDLRTSTPTADVNAFLGRGWVLLRVGDVHLGFLLGWPRERGDVVYAAWYEEEKREREKLLEAFVGGGDELLELE